MQLETSIQWGDKMKLTKRQLRQIIREEKQRLDEIGRRGPLPRQGLSGPDVDIFQMILDIIRENVMNPKTGEPACVTRDQQIRQLQYYVNNAKI